MAGRLRRVAEGWHSAGLHIRKWHESSMEGVEEIMEGGI